MMSDTYDPYRNAVRQTLEDKRRGEQRKKFNHRKKQKQKSFLKQKIYLTDFTGLPYGLSNLLFFAIFALIPYLTGTLFTFFIFAEASFTTYKDMNGSNFAFSWLIGYELIAFFLLLLIIKSAILFHTKDEDEELL